MRMMKMTTICSGVNECQGQLTIEGDSGIENERTHVKLAEDGKDDLARPEERVLDAGRRGSRLKEEED